MKISKYLLIIFFSCSHLSQASTLNDEIEKSYQLAIKYRNGEMEGYPKDSEQALNIALELFTDLSYQGHVKAMHNLAVIRYKMGDYPSAYGWFKRAGDRGLEASIHNIHKMLLDDKVCALIKESIPFFNPRARGYIGNPQVEYTTEVVQHPPLNTLNAQELRRLVRHFPMYKKDGTPHPRPILPEDEAQSRNILRFINSETQPGTYVSKSFKEAEKSDDSFKLLDSNITDVLSDILYSCEEKDGMTVSYLRNGGTTTSLTGAIHPYIPYFPYPDGCLDTEDGIDILVRQESLFPLLRNKNGIVQNISLRKATCDEAPDFQNSKRFKWVARYEDWRDENLICTLKTNGKNYYLSYLASTVLQKANIDKFKAGTHYEFKGPASLQSIPNADYYISKNDILLNIPNKIIFNHALFEVRGNLTFCSTLIYLDGLYLWPSHKITLQPQNGKENDCPIKKVIIRMANNNSPMRLHTKVIFGKVPYISIEGININKVDVIYK